MNPTKLIIDKNITVLIYIVKLFFLLNLYAMFTNKNLLIIFSIDAIDNDPLLYILTKNNNKNNPNIYNINLPLKILGLNNNSNNEIIKTSI